MFVYKTYTDVRLVFTAAQSIGKFGGDTDNWMWPRHTGDFSVFRVYADENGEPAEYSENNKPLTPKYNLPVSLDGVQPDDFTMIWGFPGSTERYMSSFGINYNVDSFYPIVYEVFKAKTDVMDKYMKIDKAVNIAYADEKAGLANTWKNFEGQMTMLRKNKVAERKAELEDSFMDWVKFGSANAMINVKNEQDYQAWLEMTKKRQAEYSDVLNSTKDLFQELSEVAKALFYPNFTAQLNQIDRISTFDEYMNAVNNYKALTTKENGKPMKAKDIEKDSVAMAAKAALDTATANLKNIDIDILFKDLDDRVEGEMLVEVLKIYRSHFTADELPETLQQLDAQYNGDFAALANDIIENSIFATAESMKAFVENPDPDAIENDIAVITQGGLIEHIYTAAPVYRKAMIGISQNDHLFVKGLREFYAETQPGKHLYPDANSIMRMSYGSVKDYSPADAITYD